LVDFDLKKAMAFFSWKIPTEKPLSEFLGEIARQLFF